MNMTEDKMALALGLMAITSWISILTFIEVSSTFQKPTNVQQLIIASPIIVGLALFIFG